MSRSQRWKRTLDGAQTLAKLSFSVFILRTLFARRKLSGFDLAKPDHLDAQLDEFREIGLIPAKLVYENDGLIAVTIQPGKQTVEADDRATAHKGG